MPAKDLIIPTALLGALKPLFKLCEHLHGLVNLKFDEPLKITGPNNLKNITSMFEHPINFAGYFYHLGSFLIAANNNKDEHWFTQDQLAFDACLSHIKEFREIDTALQTFNQQLKSHLGNMAKPEQAFAKAYISFWAYTNLSTLYNIAFKFYINHTYYYNGKRARVFVKLDNFTQDYLNYFLTAKKTIANEQLSPMYQKYLTYTEMVIQYNQTLNDVQEKYRNHDCQKNPINFIQMYNHDLQQQNEDYLPKLGQFIGPYFESFVGLPGYFLYDANELAFIQQFLNDCFIDLSMLMAKHSNYTEGCKWNKISLKTLLITQRISVLQIMTSEQYKTDSKELEKTPPNYGSYEDYYFYYAYHTQLLNHNPPDFKVSSLPGESTLQLQQNDKWYQYLLQQYPKISASTLIHYNDFDLSLIDCPDRLLSMAGFLPWEADDNMINRQLTILKNH